MPHINEYENAERIRETAVYFLKNNSLYIEGRHCRYDQKPVRFRFSRNAHSNKGYNIIGAELSKLNPVKVHLSEGVNVEVPFFLPLLVEELRSQIHTEGLFRKPGASTREQAMLESISRGNFNFKGAQPLDLCGILKRFLRNICGGVIAPRYHDAMITAMRRYQFSDNLDTLLTACLMLPKPNLDLLAYIMKLFKEIADKHESNHMTAENLAIVLAPTIMSSCVGIASPEANQTKLADERDVVTALITNADRIGFVPATIEYLECHLRTSTKERRPSRARGIRQTWRSLSAKTRAGFSSIDRNGCPHATSERNDTSSTDTAVVKTEGQTAEKSGVLSSSPQFAQPKLQRRPRAYSVTGASTGQYRNVSVIDNEFDAFLQRKLDTRINASSKHPVKQISIPQHDTTNDWKPQKATKDDKSSANVSRVSPVERESKAYFKSQNFSASGSSNSLSRGTKRAEKQSRPRSDACTDAVGSVRDQVMKVPPSATSVHPVGDTTASVDGSSSCGSVNSSCSSSVRLKISAIEITNDTISVRRRKPVGKQESENVLKVSSSTSCDILDRLQRFSVDYEGAVSSRSSEAPPTKHKNLAGNQFRIHNDTKQSSSKVGVLSKHSLAVSTTNLGTHETCLKTTKHNKHTLSERLVTCLEESSRPPSSSSSTQPSTTSRFSDDSVRKQESLTPCVATSRRGHALQVSTTDDQSLLVQRPHASPAPRTDSKKNPLFRAYKDLTPARRRQCLQELILDLSVQNTGTSQREESRKKDKSVGPGHSSPAGAVRSMRLPEHRNRNHPYARNRKHRHRSPSSRSTNA